MQYDEMKEKNGSIALEPAMQQKQQENEKQGVEEKGSKCRSRRRLRNDSSRSAFDAKDLSSSSVVPLSTSLLSLSVQRELQNIWADARRFHAVATHKYDCGGGDAVDQQTQRKKEVDVPPFKVGTLEMYKRFPEQYDLLMSHHDCRDVKDYLESVLSILQQSSMAADNNNNNNNNNCDGAKMRVLRVGDFGCGTGRIASMVSQHPAVGAVYCYDNEALMLRKCLVNVVQSVAEKRKDISAVYICPTASSYHDGKNNNNDNNNNSNNNNHSLGTSSELAGVCIGDSDVNVDTDKAVLRLCVRPVSFHDVQEGFLAHHRSCHLVVCAWSLSYVMRARWGEDRWHAAVDGVVDALVALLDTSGPAALIVIETLGTDTTEPRRKNTLPLRLEAKYGFERRWVRTDYNFGSVAEAERLTRFFFGEGIARRMREKQRTTLPECTGIWTLWRK